MEYLKYIYVHDMSIKDAPLHPDVEGLELISDEVRDDMNLRRIS